jgi:branched-chain amino acid aminotransferase
MPEFVAYFKGEWVPSDQMLIDRHDRGFRVADVVFDVARTFDGQIFKRDRHVARFYRSLKYARIDIGLSPEEFTGLLEEAVERNRHHLPEVGDLDIYFFATRGPGLWASKAGPPTVGIDPYGIPFYRHAHLFDTGVHGVISKMRGLNADQVDPKIKHQARMNFNLAELEAADVDPEAWPILLDTEGNVAEGTINSIFLVTGGVIKTAPDDHVLQSVSRGSVYELAERLGIPVAEEAIQPYDLYTADEAFLAFTGAEVLPMTRVDGREVGDGKPGPITQQLLAAWSEWVGVDIVGQAQRFSNQ